jgi:hypothetical protein
MLGRVGLSGTASGGSGEIVQHHDARSDLEGSVFEGRVFKANVVRGRDFKLGIFGGVGRRCRLCSRLSVE